MKKILFIIEHLNAGGAERSLIDILNNLNYSKYDVDLLITQEYGDYKNEIPDKVNTVLYSLDNAFGKITTVIKNAVKNRDRFSFWFRMIYYFSSVTKWSNLKYTRKLFKNSKKEYDCVVSCRQSFICNELAAYVFRGKEKVSWWHHGDLEISQEGIDRLKKAYSIMDTIVAVSQSSAAIVKEAFDLPEKKVIVIPNMLVISRIKQQSIIYKPFLPPKRLKIVSVGRFSKEKNMELCPKIGFQLKQMGVDFFWFLIGDGEDYKAVESLVSEYNLEDNFCFTGRLNNPYPYVRAADLFVHTSLVESQGIAILESMVLKTPVIVVSSKGPGEYIDNGSNGFLLDNNEKSIAKLIFEIYDKPNLLHELSAKGYETATKFSPEITMSLVDKVLT